jgi:hypothetical protein
MYLRVGECFEFEGVTYIAERYRGDVRLQCSNCDLSRDGRKRCLNDECHCGECGYPYNNRGNSLVFKAINLTEDDRKRLSEEGKLFHIERLEKRNAELSTEVKRLKSIIKEQDEHISKFKSQLRSIYANINTAIKKEIYKNL